MALVMVSTDESDTLQPLRTGTTDGLAYSNTRAATDEKCKGIVHVAEGEPVLLESIRPTDTTQWLCLGATNGSMPNAASNSSA